MTRLIWALSLFVGTCGAHSADELRDKLEALRVDHNLPALAAAGFDLDRVGPSAVVGILAHGNEAKADALSRFHLGSLTKSMTATVAGRLVEKGLIRWDTTLAEAIPQVAERVPESHHGVTLEQLLAHRSGLPSDTQPGGVTARYFQLSGDIRTQRIEAVVIAFSQQGLASPGQRFVYCNSGYIAAGAMLEAVSGKSWEDLMQKELFEPLAITSGGFGPPVGEEGRLTQPMGHLDRFTGRMPVAPGPGADNPAVLGPGATVHMTIKDLAAYAREHLLGASGMGVLLQEETYAHLHNDPESDGYALGWAIVIGDNGKVVALQHAGSNGRWFAVIRIDLEDGSGVVTATNIANEVAAKACSEADAVLVRQPASSISIED